MSRPPILRCASLAACALAAATLSVGCALEPLEEEPLAAEQSVPGSVQLAGPHVVGLETPEGIRIIAPSGWSRTRGGLPAGLRSLEGEWASTRGSLEEATARPGRAALTVTSVSTGGRDPSFGQVRTAVRSTPDGYVLTQSGELQPGSASRSWALVLSDDVTIYLPAKDGLLFDRDSPLGTRTFHYPWTWEAPFALVHGRGAGWLIRADDEQRRFKALTLAKTADGFSLRFEVEATAPLSAQTRVPEIEWHLEPYTGPWVVGAERYRRLWRERFVALRDELPGPDWVDEIGIVVRHELEDRESLEALARRIDPKHVLLYTTSWRSAGFDTELPTYVERAGFASDVAWAQARGFRVMLHVNFFGCSYEHPAWEALETFQVRELFSKEPQEWNNENFPGHRFAYINPASQQWQRFFVAEMQRLARRLRPDALHLDQNGNWENDANGRIDGATMIEGGMALHEALRRGLPEGTALSGEDLTELTAPYLDFAQRKARGAAPSIPAFRWPQLLDAHAINSYLFGDWVRSYGSLATLSSEIVELRLPWSAAYDRWGMLPTWAPSSPQALERRTPMSESFLTLARWWAETRPVVSRDARDWLDETLFAFACGDGGRVRAVTTGSGWAYEGELAPQLRRVHGARVLAPEWWIPGWPASSPSGRATLLDPDTGYLAVPRHWSRDSPWIGVGEGAMDAALSHWHQDDIHTLVRLEPSERPLVDLLALPSDIVSGLRTEAGIESISRPGVTLAAGGGSVWMLDTGLQLTAPRGSVSSEADDRRRPRAFIEWRIDLPPRPTRLRFMAGPREFRLSPPASLRAKVRAGSFRTERTVDFSGERERFDVDLSGARAPRATVRFELLSPERPEDEPSSLVLYEAALLAADAEPVELRIDLPRPPQAVAGGEPVESEPGPATYRVAVPGTLAIVHPERLEALPWIGAAGSEDGPKLWDALGPWRPRAVGGESRETMLIAPEAVLADRRSLAARVPGGGGRLSGAVGLAAERGRVRFSLEVNGARVWSTRVETDQAWVPFDVDLAPWAGQAVVLELVTDPLGTNAADWALWSFDR